MKMRTLPCREHGGNFTVPMKRGRPPVRCGGEYPACDQAATAKPVKQVSRSEMAGWCSCAVINRRRNHERGIEGCKYYAPVEPEVQAAERPRKTAHKPRTATNTAVVTEDPGDGKRVDRRAILAATAQLAFDAKAKLEAEGWTCKGRAWVEPVEINGKDMGGVPWAELIAARGEEMITLLWAGDKLKDQRYQLWNMEQPQKNEMPEKGISSEFDEFSDKELVARMAGQRVTWWNKLGKNKETAECPESVKIAHAYNGIGDETPADRIITFVDHGGGGYRSFRVGQLLKIG